MFKIMKFCAIVLGTCTCTWWYSTCYKTDDSTHRWLLADWTEPERHLCI